MQKPIATGTSTSPSASISGRVIEAVSRSAQLHMATVVAINVLPSQDRAMTTKAKADIATLEQAIETYRLDNLDFPADLQALVAAPAGLPNPERYRPGGYIRRLPEDPWGHPYQYRRRSAHNGQFDVYSLGADRKEGGEGTDADLGNWDA
jgi:general secretion pathway protein G